MRCLSRLRPASKCTFICTSGSLRPYSFASEIRNLLQSFEETPSVPPIIPVNRKTLTDFHRNVLNPKVSTKYLTRQYNLLHRTSSLRVLPTVIANGYLKRLLHDRDIQTTVKILLEYDLDEGVLVATNALKELDLHEREFCLFALQHGLQDAGQAGLMTQIMAELGYTNDRLDAFKRLTIVHDHMSRCTEDKLPEIQELCSLLAKRMRERSEHAEDLCSYSVLMLMRTSLSLGAASFCKSLCRHNWHADDALKVYLQRLPEGQMVKLMMECASSIRQILDSSGRDVAGVGACVWIINKTKSPHNLSILCDLEPRNSVVRSTLALSLSKHHLTVERSVSFASIGEIDDMAALLFEWTKFIKPFPSDRPPIEASTIQSLLSQASSPEISDIIVQYMRLINTDTNGTLEHYDFKMLMNILQILDQIPQQLSPIVQQRISRNFLNRTEDETLDYFRLAKTSAVSIDGLLKHHLHTLRTFDRHANPRNDNVDPTQSQDGQQHSKNSDDRDAIPASDSAQPVTTHSISAQFFISALTILQSQTSTPHSMSACTQAQLVACHENVVRNLLQLSSGGLVTQVLIGTWRIGLEPSKDLAPYIIRQFSLNQAKSKHITRLLGVYPTTIMTYDIYARYISRIASSTPVNAMATLDLMLKKGLSVRRRLVQNLMTGISECTTISGSRAFRYLTKIMKISTDTGIDLDRLNLASLLRVVLVRQGLGAATARISWLLKLSAKLTKTEKRTPLRHEEMVQMLRKWHVHERTRGDGSGSLRPKKLRELIDTMSTRRTVIGRSRKSKAKLKKWYIRMK